MFEPRPRQPRAADDRILPLINVVFLLLIFFMLAGSLAAPGRFPVEPPQSASTAAPAGGALTVLIAADGRVALEGRELGPDGLAAALEALKSSGEPPPPVQVKADGQADTAVVIRVLSAIRAAGLPAARLLTVRRAE